MFSAIYLFYVSKYHWNKANLRDFIAATSLVILLKLDSNRWFFSPCDLEIWWVTSKIYRAPLLHYIKLCASSQTPRLIQAGTTVRKRSIRVKTSDFFCPVWPSNLMDDLEKQKGTSSMQHSALCIISKPSVNSNWNCSPKTLDSGQNRRFFVPCDLEIWRMTLKNNRAPFLCCFKLCESFHSHWWIKT